MDVADDELGLPKSTVVKMVQDALAPLGGLRMSPECRDLVVDCCAEFVNAVASEANEISTKEKKTTINPDHVLAALRALGFEAYEAECAIARDEAKEEETEKRQMKKAKKNIGMSAEEAIAMQQQLFAQAKARMAGQDAGGGGEGEGEPGAGVGGARVVGVTDAPRVAILSLAVRIPPVSAG
jgi:histone H3/H4